MTESPFQTGDPFEISILEVIDPRTLMVRYRNKSTGAVMDVTVPTPHDTTDPKAWFFALGGQDKMRWLDQHLKSARHRSTDVDGIPDYAVLIDKRGHYQVLAADYGGPLRGGQAHGFHNGRYLATDLVAVSDEPRRYRIFVQEGVDWFPPIDQARRPQAVVVGLFELFDASKGEIGRDPSWSITLGGEDVR